MKKDASTGTASAKTVLIRQIIFSLAALAIMGIGAWSLMGQNAPYHPDFADGDVSKGEINSLHSVLSD